MSRRQVIAVGCALTLVAGCSSPDDTSSSAESNEVSTTESVTTESVTSESVTTEPTNAISADDMESDWVVIRQASADDGFWLLPEGHDPAVEYRIYSFSCADASCAELSATVGYADGFVLADDPVEFAFDGTTMTAHDISQQPCLNPAGTAWDGPEETTSTVDISLTPRFENGLLSSFTGTYELRSVSAASADCSAEDVGYQADMLMFREDRATKLALSDGVFLGEGYFPLAARGIHGCSQGSCKLREETETTSSNGTREVTYEWVLTEDDQGRFAGEFTVLDSCLHDETGVFVADEVYLVTLSVVAEQLRVAGWSEPVLLTTTALHGVQNPDSGVLPEFLEFCAPFDLEFTYGGLPTTMTDLIDFTATPVGTVD